MVERPINFSFSESCHQFFKIYTPDQCSQQLKIPPDFIKYFNGDLPYKSTITSPAKRSWQVDVNKVDDNLYFHEGWHQFVQDNSLGFGDFLIFYYGGNANFSVKIYGKNGCRKEVTDSTMKNFITLSTLEDNQTVEQKDIQTVEQRKSKRLECKTSSEKITKRTLCARRVPVAIQGYDSALEAANKFKSKFPFFKAVMRPPNVNSGLMYIPTNFRRSYLQNGGPSVTLLVSDQSWPVKLIRSEKNTFLSRGWHEFSSENTLKTGDFCVFELVERQDFVMKVHIFRCLD